MYAANIMQPAMPPPDANATPAARWYFLDWLRIAAFGLLVPYHVGMYYVRWPYLVKSPFANAGPEPWMLLTNPWRMSLLFIISGAVSSLVLQRRQGAGFMAERSRRLLLPLLCGMALIVPPQAYYEVVHKFAYAGSYADFLHLYFAGFKGFCQSGRCVALPTWNHLWFLPYVWCYALLLWLLLRLRPTSLDSLAHRCRWLLHGARLLWVPVLVIVLMRWTLYRRFPATY
ncbi:MAG: hypothetical protein RLZZ401_1521, partial [Pseudomonadota bacterium]